MRCGAHLPWIGLLLVRHPTDQLAWSSALWFMVCRRAASLAVHPPVVCHKACPVACKSARL